MLDFLLKWTLIALIFLTAFSAATVLWSAFELNLGSCSNGCDEAQTLNAYLTIGLIGIVGFGCSGFAAYIIRRSFKN